LDIDQNDLFCDLEYLCFSQSDVTPARNTVLSLCCFYPIGGDAKPCMNPTWLISMFFNCFTLEKLLNQQFCSLQTRQAGYATR